MLPEAVKSFTPTETVGNATIGDRYPQMLMIGTTGDVRVQFDGGDYFTFPGVLGGQWFYCPPFKTVTDTGTAATTVIVGVPFR